MVSGITLESDRACYRTCWQSFKPVLLPRQEGRGEMVHFNERLWFPEVTKPGAVLKSAVKRPILLEPIILCLVKSHWDETNIPTTSG